MIRKTVLTAIALIFANFPAKASPVNSPDKSIARGLQIIESLNEKHLNSCRPGEEGQSKKFPVLIGNIDLKSRSNVDQFCNSIEKACAKTYGNLFCIGSIRQLNERDQSHALYERQLKPILKSYTHSTKAQTICCGENQKCKNDLQRVGIEVHDPNLDGKPSDYWDADLWKIRLSWSTLRLCDNAECVEEIVLHELGHACESSIVRNEKAGAFTAQDQGCSGATIPVWPTWTRYYGAKATECVRNEIIHQMSERHDFPFCADHWTREAFASVAFSALMTSPFHYNRICGAKWADSAHPAMRAIIKCMSTLEH